MGISATCQRCGGTFEAASLQVLMNGCPACRKASKAANKRVPAVRRHDIPKMTSVIFDRQPLSQNSTTYDHWRVHHRDKTDWLARMRPVAVALGGTYEWSSWRITRVYGGQHKEMDFANLVGGLKTCIDCLTELGIIIDDSPSHFTMEYQQRRGDSTYTLLELLDYRF